MTKPYSVPAPGEAPDPVLTKVELDRKVLAKQATKAKAKRKDRARRRWKLLNAFVDNGMAGLELSDAVVWIALFRCAQADGIATVARARLEVLTGCERKTITEALRRLIGSKWIARLRRGGPSGGIAVYRVQNPRDVG